MLQRRKYLFLTLFWQACFDQHLLRREGGGVRFLPLPPEQVGSRSDFDLIDHFFLHSFPFCWWWWTSNVMPRYWMRYRLPEGVSCALCVLQWRYWAGNSWGRFSTQFIKISSLLIFIILVPTRCDNGSWSWCDIWSDHDNQVWKWNRKHWLRTSRGVSSLCRPCYPFFRG